MLDEVCKKYLLRGSKIPTKFLETKLNPDFINSDLNSDKEVHLHLYNKYMKDFDWIKSGSNLLIWGENCGSGKTLWASKIAQKYIMTACNAVCTEHNENVLVSAKSEEWYYRVLYISFTDFIMKIKDNLNNYTSEVKHMTTALKQADLVIWDDVLSDFRELPASVWETLYSVMDTRCGVKANIYTSNRDPKIWQQNLGAEIVSRMMINCEVVKFKNVDLRGML